MRYRQLPYKAGIYVITNAVNGKLYVGSACDLSERRRRHFGHLRTNRHFNPHLQSAWNRYGEDGFRFQVLLVCDRSSLIFFEQRAIDRFLSTYSKNHIYNQCHTAGSRLGLLLRPESRAKLSANNTRPFLGKKHSLETRARMSAAAKVRCAKPGEKERLLLIGSGHIDSAATREKRRRSALARPVAFTDFARQRSRETKIGKPRSRELKRKLSEINKGT